MATYKVWLTVKDRYGNTKEIDGGNVTVGLDELTQADVNFIEEALPLEDYIKRENLDAELEAYATDTEVSTALRDNESIRYSDFELED